MADSPVFPSPGTDEGHYAGTPPRSRPGSQIPRGQDKQHKDGMVYPAKWFSGK